MPTVVGVKLRFAPKPLVLDLAGCDVTPGQSVLVRTERGLELGQVIDVPYEVESSELPGPLRPIERAATDEDLATSRELAEKEREAMPVYRQLIEEYRLGMKPVDVEYLFGGEKAVFYFVAEERVDFRELVRELASRFKIRIDMRQVGVRDEARMVGGLGHCGQQLCCVRFGGEFQPVSIRMAKDQDLPLNPLKISGLCGRLMCCLRYEHEAYKDFKSRAPKRGAKIETPLGEGKVTGLNTPRETVDVRLAEGGSLTVPLTAIDCPGGGCPCRISAEALDAVAPKAPTPGGPVGGDLPVRDSGPASAGSRIGAPAERRSPRTARRRAPSAEPQEAGAAQVPSGIRREPGGEEG